MNPASGCLFLFPLPLLGFPVGWFVVAVELPCAGRSHLVSASGGRAGFSGSSWQFSAAHWVCQSSCCRVQAVMRITAKTSTGIASVQNLQNVPVCN